LIDRYFSAMSTRPAYVMGALLRLTKQIQAQVSIPGAGLYLESTIADILSRVDCDPPNTLDLKEQANFALGFYHQRHQSMKKPVQPVAAADTEGPSEQKGNE
jgi:CRISPR-associated protein Csd1